MNYLVGMNLRFGMTLWRFVLTAALLVTLFGTASREAAGDTAPAWRMSAVSDSDHLWIILQDGEAQRIRILLRRSEDTQPDAARRFGSYTGRIQSNGIAASEGRLWLAFTDGTVHTFHLVRDPGSGVVGRDSTREARLPAGADLRSVAAGRRHAWALVRVVDRDTLAQIDAGREQQAAPSDVPSPDDADPEALLPDDEPGDPPRDEEAEPARPAIVPPAAEPSRFPVDRLLRLTGQTWQAVDLPDDWPHDGRSWAVMRSPQDAMPMLLTATRSDGRDELWLYRHRNSAWEKQAYPMELTGLLDPVVVDSQVLIARRLPAAGRIAIEVAALRQSFMPIGVIAMDAPDDATFSLTAWNQGVALIVRDAQGSTRWTQMDLRGQTALEPVELIEATAPIADELVRMLLMLGPLVVIIVLLTLMWKRDPEANRLQLPADVNLAELTKRMIAAGIDMAPGMLLASYLFGMSPVEIFRNWPWMGGAELETIYPALTTIGLFILTTLSFELLTARTPGKMLLGMMVTDLKGKPPRFWSVVGRNVFKAMDLIFVALLVLPLLGAYRQRLGDLLARTVVINLPMGTRPPGDDRGEEGDDEEEAQENEAFRRPPSESADAADKPSNGDREPREDRVSAKQE